MNNCFKDWSQPRAISAWVLVLKICKTFGSARVIWVFIATASIVGSYETARLRRLTRAVAARINTVDPKIGSVGIWKLDMQDYTHINEYNTISPCTWYFR